MIISYVHNKLSVEIVVFVHVCVYIARKVGVIDRVGCIYSGTEWVDPYDPTVVAESELISAANSIEAAARKLSQLQPRASVTKVGTV